MFRIGASGPSMRPMKAEDIFLQRLKLLIIMAKAYLKNYPIGELRKAAVLENSRFVSYEVLYQYDRNGSLCSQSNPSLRCNDLKEQQIFYQRVQLLAVMVKACIEKTDFGSYRKKAMAENIAQICDYLADQLHISDVQFLKVA